MKLFLYKILEKESYDANWYHGYDDVEQVVLLIIEFRDTIAAWYKVLAVFAGSDKKPHNFFP